MARGSLHAVLRRTSAAPFALALAAAAPACQISVDYSGTTYRCDQYGQCPPGFECLAGACVPIGSADAGADAPFQPTDASDDAAAVTDAAPPDAEVAAPCGTTARLMDDFDDGVTGPQWATGFEDTGATRSEEDGQLVIRVTGGAGDVWAGYSSLHVHDLTGQHVQIRVDQVGPIYTVLEIEHHSGPRAQLFESAGAVRAAVYGAAGENGEFAELPYDPVAHKWWRIREEDGTLYWELSADGSAWTELYQEPDPFPPDKVFVLLSAGGAMETDTEARMDDLNPDGDAEQPWCPIATLTDDFEDGAFADSWADSWSETGCTLEESDGEAKILFDGTASVACGYETARVYDACDGQVAIHVTEPLDVADAEMWMTAYFPNDDSSAEISYGNDMLHITKRVGASTPLSLSMTYSSAHHRWWRIRESGGTLSWETSPNGVSWTTQATQPTGSDCSTTYVDFGAGVLDTWAGGAAEVHFDDFNLLP